METFDEEECRFRKSAEDRDELAMIKKFGPYVVKPKSTRISRTTVLRVDRDLTPPRAINLTVERK